MSRVGADEELFTDDSGSDIESIDDRDLEDATLPEPEPVQIKVSTLHRRYRNGLIELHPYYQREVVWPAVRQSGLINSIFNNYYIPPVIFKVVKVQNPDTPNARPTVYQTAIDGKQRLSSIIEFMAGRIPYKDPRGVTWWYPVMEATERKGRLLTKELKDRFDNWSLLCIEYTGLKQQQEEDLFARVQQGMALSNNEKQMASHTPWIKLIKEVMKTYKLVTEICGDMKRGKDFGNVANVIVSAFYYDHLNQNEPLGLKTSQSSLSRVINKMDYGRPSTKFSGRIRLIFKTWTDLYNASPQTFSNEWPGQSLRKFSPIEFLATGVVLHLYIDERDDETLIGDIDAMRKYIRSDNKVVDLRTNTGTWRWFWSFIDELEDHRGPGNRPASGQRTIPQAVDLDPHPEIPHVSRDRLILASGPVAPGTTTTPRRTPAKTNRPPKSNGKTLGDSEQSSKKRKFSETTDNSQKTPSTIQQTPVAKAIETNSTKLVQAGRTTGGEVDHEPDDEIFATHNRPQEHGPGSAPMGQSVPLQANIALPPGFSPELMNMWASMQALHAQQQQQQQQQHSQGQHAQGAVAMPPTYPYPLPGYPANAQYAPGPPQQWQQVPFKPQLQQPQPVASPQLKSPEHQSNGNAREQKRNKIRIDLEED